MKRGLNNFQVDNFAQSLIRKAFVKCTIRDAFVNRATIRFVLQE